MRTFKLNIRGRLFAGFGLLIALLVAIIVPSVMRSESSRTDVASMRRFAAASLAVADMATDLQAVRRALLRYVFDQDEPSITEAATRLDKVAAGVENRAKVSVSDERRARYKLVAADVDQIKQAQVSMHDAVRGFIAARAALFKEGDKLGGAVKLLAESAQGTPVAADARMVETDVLLLRVANWRFLATKDPNGPATFDAALRRATKDVEDLQAGELSSRVKEKIAPVISGLQAYKAAFDLAAEQMIAANNGYYEVVAPLTKKAIERMDEMKAELLGVYEASASQADGQLGQSVNLNIIGGAVAVLLGVLIAFFIGRAISNPVVAMVAAMTKLARGDTSADIPGANRADELGDMAKAVEVFKAGMVEAERLRAQQRELEQAAAERRAQDMRKLADEFEGAVGEIIATVSSASTQLETSAATLTQTANHSQSVTTTVAAASEQATTNVQSVASATEELASSVNEISRQVQASTRMAVAAVDQARGTNRRVGALADAAAKIGDVVDLINTIAAQTNLLALNATIEAARAGDAGRGFAVVATEVKALAQQTAKATEDISHQIAGIQAATKESVVAIEEVGATIEQISGITTTIASAVEEQSTATQEIARNVQQAAAGTREVSQSIVEVQHGAGETGSASAQVFAAATSLSHDSQVLREKVAQFLKTVRAA